MSDMPELRNLAIIAHVDHGKTTLVDAMLRQSGTFRDNQQVSERVMDSNDLERERGITILAKCTSLNWQDEDTGHSYRFNIVDTPGHADFGGEVERILGMVDGVIVLIDAAEGPMPQTKFVLTKALAIGLRPIVVINKVDRSDARIEEVINEIFDLFVILQATDEQLDYPTLFASGRSGWATTDFDAAIAPNAAEGKNLKPLFKTIANYIKPPVAQLDAPFAFLATTLESNQYLGRVLTGRIHQGQINVNTNVRVLDSNGSIVEEGRLTKILAFHGIERRPIESARAGDIIAIAGLSKATVGHTIAVPEVANPLPALPIDPPTLEMTFSVNDSPLVGTEGQNNVTSRMIGERLMREAEGNVALQVKPTANQDAFAVAGRGELQLGVLIETMRREGFELSISRPRVLYQVDPKTKERLEPIEEVFIDVDEDHTGVVMEKMGLRKGIMKDMRPSGGGKVRLTFLCPSRGLIGYLSELLSDTRGTALMSRLFHGYEEYKGPIQGRRNGVLISNASGKVVAYALANLEERGIMFVSPGDAVYVGMIIGEHNRENDLEVNPTKEKQLSNVRAAGKDDAIRLTPPAKMTLEKALSYIQNDELVEVTPKNLRLRKALLDANDRKRASRSKDSQ